MGATIRKSYTIFTIGSITITGFILSKVGTRVVISNSISISVDSWAIMSRLRMSNWVNNGSMVDRGMVNRDVVDRGMVDRSSMKDRSMVDSMMDRGMVNSMVSRCMMDRVDSMMDGVDTMVNGVDSMGNSSMVDKRFVGMEGNGGMVGSSILLLVVVLMDLIRGSSWLAVDSCAIATMGFVDGGSDSRGIAVFDALVAVLIGGSQSQKGQESDKSLKKIRSN